MLMVIMLLQWFFLIELIHALAINILTRKVSVRLSVCNGCTSLPQRVLWERGYNVYRNAYAGNESPNCWSRHWSALISRHSHSYRRATKVRQTTLEQAKTVLSTSRTLSQATKVRLSLAWPAHSHACEWAGRARLGDAEV